MKYLRLLLQITLLCGISLLGTIIARILNIGIPGSIIGMALLFLLMERKFIDLKWIEAGANFLLAELLLFFIPSSVGIIEYKNSFSNPVLLSLLFTIVSSTVAVVVFVILATEAVSRYRRKGDRLC
ncbi:CidA/LrgA family protein [Sporomusa aerivorans]|uniref:CidA/LrgA family protein n=1 Tax=Sporomusa aerivorans TaxID=204936 RepID=UPI00352AC11F